MELTIAQLERNAEDGGVTIAHWRAAKQDGEFSASSYGTCSFTPDPTVEGFVPFEELTKEIVIAWVASTLDLEALEDNLAASIKIQKEPVSISGMPWTE